MLYQNDLRGEIMTIESKILKHTNLKLSKSPIKNYRENPGNLTKAVYAALHYVIKNKKNYFVIPGNSYGNFIFHVVDEKEDLRSLGHYTGKEVSGIMIDTENNGFSVVIKV